MLRSLRRVISGAGFQVSTFDRASELLKSDFSKSDACLLVDIYLPEMSGVEVCEALAASGRLLPVVLITGRLYDGIEDDAQRARATAVLVKPFGRRRLLDAILKALSANT